MKQTGIIGITELGDEIKTKKYKNSSGIDYLVIDVNNARIENVTRADLVGLIEYMESTQKPTEDNLLSKIARGECKGTYIDSKTEPMIRASVEVAESKKEQKPKAIDASIPIKKNKKTWKR